MATVSGNGSPIGKGVHRHIWENFTATGEGTALDAFAYPDKTVTIQGTFGTGTTTVVMQGSNDSTSTGGNWHTLADPNGNAISKTAAAIEAILENPKFIRPQITSVSATTDVDVIVVSNSGQR